MDLGVDNSIIKIDKKGMGSAKIKGIVHLDIFKFIAKTMGESLQTDYLDLNSVANELLGKGKVSVDIEALSYIEENIIDYFKYALNDSILTYEIFEKLLPNLNELSKIINQPIYDVCRMSYGQLVENYLIYKAK